jgi:hypothetical protein
MPTEWSGKHFPRISNDIKRIFDNNKTKTDPHAETPSKRFYVDKRSLRYDSLLGTTVSNRFWK